MKVYIVFALALTTTSGFDLREAVVPVSKTKVRITNGQDAYDGQFPHQAGLLMLQNDNTYKWCGGSMIGNEYVLTVAHCVFNIKKLYVYLGATKRSSPRAAHSIEKAAIIIHSGYNSATLENDIALIKIPYTAYTEYIQNVELPAIASSYPSYAGHIAIVSGWGRVSDSSTDLPDQLQWAELEVMTNEVCARYFPDYITSSTICVFTFGGVSTCDGDSGSPLTVKGKNIQIGLSSFTAAEGCTKEHPAGFTRVTSYLNWIELYTGISN